MFDYEGIIDASEAEECLFLSLVLVFASQGEQGAPGQAGEPGSPGEMGPPGEGGLKGARGTRGPQVSAFTSHSLHRLFLSCSPVSSPWLRPFPWCSHSRS